MRGVSAINPSTGYIPGYYAWTEILFIKLNLFTYMCCGLHYKKAMFIMAVCKFIFAASV